MRALLSCLCLLLLQPLASSAATSARAAAPATAQEPDILLYGGRKYDLHANPLESFFKTEGERPKFLVRPGAMSTGNWRGYVATWMIEDGTLYLVGIDSWLCRGFASNCRRASLKGLFGRRYRAGRVRADWFTGELRVPDGKMLQYVHMGYGSVYEREIRFRVEAGKVTGESVVDNTGKELPPALELQRRELEKMRPKP